MVGFSAVYTETFSESSNAQNTTDAKQSQFVSSNDVQLRHLRSAKYQRKSERAAERNISDALRPFSRESFSNLNQFLEFTTPSVQLQYLPKTCTWDQCLKRGRLLEVESIPFFTLGELWDSFNEWSAYGAGVPLFLKGEENVVQYYVPYLSALQLYTRSDITPYLNLRKWGDESDASDCDLRDASSETSSDGETESISGLDFRSKCKSMCERSRNMIILRNKPKTRCRHGASVKLEAAINEEEIFEGHSRSGLVFEYFERAAPYTRIPLVDKIRELVNDFPELRTLQSVELLPQSWFSIAWYPIYRIPTGPTLRDLAACFLTFHLLSTPFQGAQYDAHHPLKNKIHSNHVLIDRKMEKALLHSFGLASYKLRGSFWTSVGSSERQIASSLQDVAELWLKEHHIHHPDFEFFVSHAVPGPQ